MESECRWLKEVFAIDFVRTQTNALDLRPLGSKAAANARLERLKLAKRMLELIAEHETELQGG